MIIGLRVAEPFVVGLQLGGIQTPAALAIIERTPGRGESDPVQHELRLLQRWAPGLPYTMIVRQVTQRLRMALRVENQNRDALGHPVRTMLAEQTSALVVNATGVGKMALDVLEADLPNLRTVAAWVTTGDQAIEEAEGWRVPQRDLVAVVHLLDQQERLEIREGLAEGAELRAQMNAFQLVPGASGRDRYDPTGGDDLVLATSLACWFGELVSPARVEVVDGPLTYREALEYEMSRRRIKSTPARPAGPMPEGVG